MNFHILYRTGFLVILFFIGAAKLSAEEIVIEGRILNEVDKKPVDFATIVVLEARKKAYSDKQGLYKISLPATGEYTIRVTSSGWKALQKKIRITASQKLDLYLSPARVQGQTLVIRTDRDIQKVSRHTMTIKQLKETPATLGDPLNALTTLPGINRSFGVFGSIVVRAMTGTYGISNWFEIDGMPMLYPQHFGGIHAVVSLDLIEEIDLYASAFPAQFGNTYSAVFSFNTKDDVKEAGGFASINIISANFELHTPIDKQGSYVMVAGRAGYLSLLVPAITKAMGNEVDQLPDYFDYQFKIKKYLDQQGHHSVRALFMGAKDEWKFVMDSENLDDAPQDVDPFNFFWRFRVKNGFDNMGLYYTYQPSKKFSFEQLAFGSYNTYTTIFDNQYLPESIQGGINNQSNQFIYGFKNKAHWQWLPKFADLRGGTEMIFFNFDSEINSIVPNGSPENMDIFAEGNFELYKAKTDLLNLGIGAFIENKFTYQGWTFTPGVRMDWLRITGNSTRDNGRIINDKQNMDPIVSPRGLIAYTFPSDTTIAVAGGIYFSYVQSSIFWMQQAPEITAAYYAKPEKAIHRVISVEQKWGLNLIKAEVFYNNLEDMIVVDQRDFSRFDKYGEIMVTRNSGQGENKGFEIMLRRDKRDNADGFYGWLSYTYTDARFRLGISQLNFTSTQLINNAKINPLKDDGTPKTPAELQKETDEYNAADNEWFDNDYEIKHSIKFTGGYAWGNHSFSMRYEMATSRPYTPIVANADPTDYVSNGQTRQRYAPIYGERNTKRYDASHRFDFRYAYKANYSWGYASFYIELILLTNPVKEENWDYSRPYSATNPALEKPDGRIPFIPLIGGEIKF